MKTSEIVAYGLAIALAVVLVVTDQMKSNRKEGEPPGTYIYPRERNAISLSEAQDIVDRAQQKAAPQIPPHFPSEIGTTAPAAIPPTSGWSSSGWPAGSLYSGGSDGTLAEREEARDAVMDAAAELQQATSAVRFSGDWRRDMPNIESKLDELESALDDAESLDVENTDDLRSEVERLRGNLPRLGYENWRGVLPDLERAGEEAVSAAEDLDVGEAAEED